MRSHGTARRVTLVCGAFIAIFVAGSMLLSQTTSNTPSTPDPAVDLFIEGSPDMLREQYNDIRRRLAAANARLTRWNELKDGVARALEGLRAANPPLDDAIRKLQLETIRPVPNVQTNRKLRADVESVFQLFYNPFQAAFDQIQPPYQDPSQPSAIPNEVFSAVRAARKPYDEWLYSGNYRLIVDFLQPPRGPGGTIDATLAISGKELADAIDNVLPRSRFDTMKTETIKLLEELSANATQQASAAQKEVQAATQQQSNVLKKIEESRMNINSLAIKLGLPAFCLTILILVLGSQWILVQQKASQQPGLAYSPDVLLELITVMLLTMTILILGLATRIQGEVLGTLLGGISGYVLNRLRNNGRPPANQTQQGAVP